METKTTVFRVLGHAFSGHGDFIVEVDDITAESYDEDVKNAVDRMGDYMEVDYVDVIKVVTITENVYSNKAEAEILMADYLTDLRADT